MALAFHQGVTIPSGQLPVDESILRGDRVLRMLLNCKGLRAEGMIRPLVSFEPDGTETEPSWELLRDFMISQPRSDALVITLAPLAKRSGPPSGLPLLPRQAAQASSPTDGPAIAQLRELMQVGPYSGAGFVFRPTAGGRLLAETDSRYCQNKGGEHNSNRVYFIGLGAD